MPDNLSFEGMTAGQMLKAARESRGLSVADICEKLKLRPEVIEALENDAGSTLKMAPVFVKGHARAIAEHLGVPADIFKSALDSGAAYRAGPMLQDEAKLEEVASRHKKNSEGRKSSHKSSKNKSSDAQKFIILGAMAAVACGCIYFALAGGKGPVSEESKPKSEVKVDVYEFEGMSDIDVSKVDSENFDPNAYAPSADLTADSIKNRSQAARLEEFKAMQQGKEVPLTAVTGQTAKPAEANAAQDAKSEPRAETKEAAAAPEPLKAEEKQPKEGPKKAESADKSESNGAAKAEAPKGEDPNAPKKLVQEGLSGKPQAGEIEVAIPMADPSQANAGEKSVEAPAAPKPAEKMQIQAKDETQAAESSDKKQEENAKADEAAPKADVADAPKNAAGLKPEGTRTKGQLQVAKADSYKVSFSFKEECWVEVRSAGKVVASKLNPAGTSLEAVAPEAPVSLKFGAPQAVVLSINGQIVDLGNAKPGSLYKLEITAK